jgi:hypothetical protein
MLSIMPLSDRYALAGDAERARLLIAGDTFAAMGTPTPQTVGFLFMAVAVMIISVIMLRDGHFFRRFTAWIGVGAAAFTFADHLSLVIAPSLAAPLMVASGLFWIPWWILIGLELFRLSNRVTAEVV